MTVHDLLVALVTLLAVVAVTTTISRWLGLGSVLAMLVAGIAIGPFGFAIASDVERIRGVSELGVVLLLFAIGLEMEPRRLAITPLLLSAADALVGARSRHEGLAQVDFIGSGRSADDERRGPRVT